MTFQFEKLTQGQVSQFKDLIFLFGKEFQQPDIYAPSKVSHDYLTNFLNHPHHIVLVAYHQQKIIGGLVAYLLEKFEQARKEIYIYDLAVAENFRRKKVATNLILTLKKMAKEIGAYVIFVQADYVDLPAIKLYESLGVKESVLHFDIDVDQ